MPDSVAGGEARNGMTGSPESTRGSLRRRAFILKALAAVGAYVAGVLAVVGGRNLVGPVLPQHYRWSLWPRSATAPTLVFKSAWTPVGVVADIPDAKTTLVTVKAPVEDAWASGDQPVAVYVKRSGDQLMVFDIHCTHLGCAVRWTQGAGRFFCPCHGGVYGADGQVLAGPPPLPLYQYPIRVENGTLYIRPRAGGTS